jgi:tetratricopeptide (TPR) repeat protein
LKNNILYSITGILLGFILGFFLANTIARRARDEASATANSSTKQAQMAAQQAQQEQSSGGGADSAAPQVSEEQVRAVIAKTDAKPEDTTLQKNVGLALYQLALQTQEPRWLPDAARFVKRAYDADPKDHELTLALAEILFNIGQTSDPASFNEARTYYAKALEQKPDDVDARTDLGLTYYFANPSDPQRAIAEYRKSLALNPKHELTLQNLATALITTGNRDEAQKRIDELQSINPTNPALPNLRAQLAQSKNAAQE